MSLHILTVTNAPLLPALQAFEAQGSSLLGRIKHLISLVQQKRKERRQQVTEGRAGGGVNQLNYRKGCKSYNQLCTAIIEYLQGVCHAHYREDAFLASGVLLS